MEKLRFAWDTAKARANQKKHGVSFEEARSVFYDECAVQFFDDEHTAWEDRYLLLGMSTSARLLLVVHCFKESDGVIRIISARKATRSESSHYTRY